MIGKVMTGKSFGGCISYVVNKAEAVILDVQGVRIDSAERISRDFDLQRKMNPELSQAVGHIALSWSINDKDKLNESVMTQVAKAYLEKMNIRDTQYLIALHQDRQHPHVHIIYNRVNNQGKTISDRFQRQLNGKVCKEITMAYGYHLAEGKQSVNRNRLRGADKEKYQLFDAISKAVSQSSTWTSLEEKLGRRGISVQYKYKSGTTEVQGVSFGKSGGGGSTAIVSFKGSELDRSLSYGNISKDLAQNRRALGLEPLSVGAARPDSDWNDTNKNYPRTPVFSHVNDLAAQASDQNSTTYQGTGNSKIASQETESAALAVTETAGQLVTSLLSGLSFSSADEDDEQRKKKKKQSYKR